MRSRIEAVSACRQGVADVASVACVSALAELMLRMMEVEVLFIVDSLVLFVNFCGLLIPPKESFASCVSI